MRERLKSKWIDFKDLEAWANRARANGLTIATLNGSFDLFHSGHLYILEEAAKTADLLIVALNSDSSISAYKSPNRPIVPLEHRQLLIAALECVSAVTSFEETTPCRFIESVRPNIHVNGSEYGQNCIEASICKKNWSQSCSYRAIRGPFHFKYHR